METIAFVQGVLSVIGVLMVVGMVWVISKIKDLTSYIDTIQLQVDNLERDIHTEVQIQNQNLEQNIEQTYRDMDSRFDKFENRISQKQLLKD